MADLARSEMLRLAAQRHGDPLEALHAADRVIAAAEVPPERRSLALWVRGLALHELGDTSVAVEAFTEASSIARHHGLADAEARASANLAISLVQLGDTALARAALERAQAVTPASSRGLVTYLSALFEQRLGHHVLAFAHYGTALPLLEAVGDTASVAGLHLNRGVLFAYRNDLVAAIREYALAESAAHRERLVILEAMAAHNLGFAVGRLGDVASALDALDRARCGYERLGYAPRQVPMLHSDRAEVLLSAGLGSLAQPAARAAVDELEDTGNLVDLTEARLLLARVCLATGDHAAASTAAAGAADGFRRAGREAWTVFAAYTGLQAEVSALAPRDVPSGRLLARCARTADRLAGAGWVIESSDAHAWAARIAAARGDRGRARRELQAMNAGRGRLSLAQVVNRWHARAALSLASGDLRGARRAVAAGLGAVERHRSEMRATQARVEAANLTAALARLGVELALRDGTPNAVFRAAERVRATALNFTPVPPPMESPIAAELERLRAASDQPAESGHERRAGHGPGVEEIETAITHHALRTRAQPMRFATARLSLVRSSLGHRILIEYVEHDGQLYAVVASARRSRLVALGPVEPVRTARAFLDAALARMIRRGPHHAAGSAAAFTRAASELDDLLLCPLQLDADDLIIVPTGRLHGLAWAGLPSLRERCFCVAPSATLWLQRAHRQQSVDPNRVVIVCGPGLPGADRETALLARRYPTATVLTGPSATCARVLAALEQSDLAHIAAHGVFRSDNPMFSSLRLADGPLTIYDLERLRAVPERIVLTACETGSAFVTATDEMLGTAVALLSLGVCTVAAPSAPVPDGALSDFSLEVHDALAAGQPMRVAIRQAAGCALDRDDQLAFATAVCFSAIGAG